MRAYHFGNFYMSSIQQGIQAAHAQMEMFVKYNNYSTDECEATYMLMDWAINHKTMSCLNGGMNVDLEDIKQLMEHSENKYPWSYFNESQEAMNGMLTNIVIVLPVTIYDMAKKLKSNKRYKFYNNRVIYTSVYNEYGDELHNDIVMEVTDFEIELINLLNKCQLAK